jgi:arylsulfatase A-like enzyme
MAGRQASARHRFAAGFVLCGILAGCSGRAEPRRTIRLIDELPRAEIAWPESLPPLPEGGVRFGGHYIGAVHEREPRALGLVRLGLGDSLDERVALLSPARGALRFRLELPRKATLRLDLARVPSKPVPPGPLRFSVRLTPEGGRESVLLERSLNAAAEAAWDEISVPLAAWGGRRVVLELALAGDAAAGWGAWSSPRIDVDEVRDPRPSVILISLDTLRADHLGCYGYSRPTSPHLDAFAARNVRFEHAIAQAPWTRPSHRAMLSGLYPSEKTQGPERFLAVPFWLAGYRTAAVTAGGQVDSRFGFGAGFEAYRVEHWVESPERLVEGLASSSPEPFFLFLHTFAIHEPYTDTRFTVGMPPGRVGDRFTKALEQRLGQSIQPEERRYAEALYDGGIAYTDERLGRFFAAAERAGWLERAIVVVTSDHGEQFWEHGNWGHGQTLYDHQLRVPLIVSLPGALRRSLGEAGSGKRVVAEQVRLVDLYPTLLELTGLPRPRLLAGRSLRPLLAGEPQSPVEAFAENVNIRPVERKGLRTQRYKFVLTFPRRAMVGGPQEYQLFDLRADPGEQTNLAKAHPELVQSFLKRLLQHHGGELNDYEEEVPEDVDPELRKRLQALGYLGG